MSRSLIRRGKEDSFFDSFFSLSTPSFFSKEFTRLQDLVDNTGFLSDGQNKDIEIIKNEEIGGVTLTVDLPGVKKEDLNIDYKDGFISINGSRKEETKDKLFSSVKYGTFSIKRHVGEVEEDKINARLNDGVLTVDIPLKNVNETEQKRIEIQ